MVCFPVKPETTLKCLLIVFLFCLTDNSYSQGFQSIFGKDSTSWYIASYFFDYTKTDSFRHVKDSTIDGTKWKKLNPVLNLYSGGLFLEDTVSGKVWYRSLHPSDTSTHLVFDFSLLPGDTFNINNGWKNYTSLEKIVDSVYYINGRKHIRFNGAIGQGFMSTERLVFIEGAGSNIGPLYKDPVLRNSRSYLLCSYKNGLKEFSNTRFQGNCNVEIMALPAVGAEMDVEVFPSPFSDQLFIKNNSGRILSRITLFDSMGNLAFISAYKDQLNLSHLAKGFYIMVIEMANGKRYARKIWKL